MNKEKKVYLDYAATTPVDERVLAEMLPYFSENFGNANSAHSFGREGADALDASRRIVAAELNAKLSEVYFTSGGSEANNWAVKGLCRSDAHRRRILISAIEHPSVTESAFQMRSLGFEAEEIPVGGNGVIDISAFEKLIDDRVALVSIMLVNNELGSIQPIKKLAELAHSFGAVFHCDCVQALGSLRLNFSELGVDALSISAHKIYGPKGIGALVLKDGVAINKLISGGYQERSHRGGTSNVPLAVGFAKALEISNSILDLEKTRLIALNRLFLGSILSDIVRVTRNADGNQCIPAIISIRFDDVSGSALIQLLDIRGIACSSGAACSAGSVKPSRVLSAIGLSNSEAESSVRFSFGRTIGEQEVRFAVEQIRQSVEKLRSIRK